MKKTGQIIIGIFMLWLSAFSSPPLSAETGQIKLSYANFMQPGTFPCVQMERWKTEVEKAASGKVGIKTFPNSTLLSAKDMMDGVIAGKADIGLICTAYEPERFILPNAVSLPLGIPDARTGSLVLLEIYKKYKPESLARVKVLTVFTNAPANIMSKKPVKTIEDVKGMNLKASGGGGDILKAWGANLVDIPMSETPAAIEKGLAEGLFSSLDVMKGLNFAEHCRYVAITDTVVYPFAVIMNSERWNGLPEDVKKIMENLSADHAMWTGKYEDDYVKEAIAWSKEKYQVEVTEFDELYRAKFNYLLWPLTQKWMEKAKAEGLPAGDIVMDIRRFIKQHTGQKK